ncbi:MAG: hypothetical protein ACOY0T_11840 [Myxococcota bacterium]
MFGKSPLGAGWLVLVTSCLGALATACLDRPLCAEPDCRPELTNQFVMRVPTGGINKVDLLFMIDNSASMADKQKLLSAAVPSLLSRFVSPLCLDDKGNPNGAHVVDGRCAAGLPEFPPIADIHIGVITSSLGIPGDDQMCPRTDVPTTTRDDRAWLLPKARISQNLASWENSGFLAWDPTGTKNQPPGTRSQSDLQRDFQNLVAKAGETGCGYEASLESWYRFLVDPEPPLTTAIKNDVSVAVGKDENLLAQRKAFLRPDSLVAILMLSDENDCSIRLGGQGFLMKSTLPRSTAICQTNPDDACCRSCNSAESAPPQGCQPLNEDASCKKGSIYLGTEDPSNLRCFDQKRRYGVDFLEPTDKYVKALTQTRILDRNGAMQPNPLFAARDGKPERDPKLVFLAGIVGVPWQDIATDATRAGPGLRYLTAKELREKGRWDMILGDPKTGKRPTDPHMIESIAPRSGENPLLTAASGGAIAPPTSSSPTASVINGHEQSATEDLQYACIFELETPVDCTRTTSNCDCPERKDTDPALNRALCQPPSGGVPGTTQYYAKAYPGTRHLEVLKGIGDQAVVASICPKVARSANPDSDPNYGYNPAVAAIVDTLRPQLANRCLPRAPTVESDGHTSCRVLETRFTKDCDCTKPGRKQANEEALASIVADLHREKACGVQGAPACEDVCACEISESEGDALTTCRSLTDPSAQAPGFCYIDAEKKLGDAKLLQGCPSNQQRLLRFVGPETPRPGSLTFMACMGQPNATTR